MTDTILKIENLSKQYRLGTVGTGTLSHDLTRWWHKVRGKGDPYLKIGEVNNRATAANSPYVWALKDINFEVKRGEVLGIIGKNGAGKSTLLKILSRVTGPTTGEIKSNGRIASLLEVGTGFHPELTGRENIFLNGAILGMSRSEIASKIDEIVSFSGCERYIDTPTKRYSSGMTVRLAFAVAAHLEPDILIVDEVLAVGDAEFQKKAIGKMQDIAQGQGRTVLFVSHNMAAVKSLCTRGILLENGTLVKGGAVDVVIDHYLSSSINKSDTFFELNAKADLFIQSGMILNKGRASNSFSFNDQVVIILKIQTRVEDRAVIGIKVRRLDDTVIFYEEKKLEGYVEVSKIKINLKSKILAPGDYLIDILYHIPNQCFLQKLEKCLTFKINETGSGLERYGGIDLGCIRLENNWEIT